MRNNPISFQFNVKSERSTYSYQRENKILRL